MLKVPRGCGLLSVQEDNWMGDPLFAERELLPEESLGQEGTVRARLLPPQTQDTRALVTGLPHDIKTLS